MTKLMLIDATHAEETRVAVVKNGQIEDFDFEARGKRQLRGNIYLAKVTRVEPSLQAAFVDYGGNRHGFLAFTEIHPDYYQIPKEDREALLAEAAAAEDDDDGHDEVVEAHGHADHDPADHDHGDHADEHHDHGDHEHAEIDASSDAHAADDHDDVGAHDEASADHDTAQEGAGHDGADDDQPRVRYAEAATDIEPHERVDAPVAKPAASDADHDDEEEEDDAESEAVARRRAAVFMRKYRIQEVIRRRQVLLVQVVKEERGNKGAALTTYLSLAGRYCVLMPNTSRSGGVSRKITNAADRKRLKGIVSQLEIPRGAGLIVRTAGAKRTRDEIVRDFEYLITLWKQIVERTIESIAPCLIHEEGHLVLRAVRDLYDKDVEQIVVDGDPAYAEVKTFVEMLMPNHAHKVTHHNEGPPLFVQTGVEDQLESIFSPTVQLPSGGYIVINQTEALVAVDVNSGRATRERNVESTALRTNLEAAAEICRQMRLRDLAGLIVIDFIDMEETRNIRAVERRMADCLKIDRARVQTGRISQFGLFEISRQRRRAGVLELTSELCPHCAGTGRVRSVESAAVQILRMIDARAADQRVDTVQVQAAPDVALYILNEKRATIAEIERRNDITVRIEANATLKSGEAIVEAKDEDGEVLTYKPAASINTGRLRPPPAPAHAEDAEDDEEISDEADSRSGGSDDEDDDEDGARRRRGRRGGRRRRGGRDGHDAREGRDHRDGRDNRDNRDIEARPAQAAEARPASTDSEDRGDRRGGRRRRRGRERERDQRNRTPDIAADGGEMLDAIASAPFLLAAQSHDEHGPSGEDAEDLSASSAPDSAMPSEAVETKSASRRETPVADRPPVDHETASSDPEFAPSQAGDERASRAQPAAAEDTRRHSIHGDAEPEAPPAEDKPRRFGWWNRKKAG